ncbi:MAG: sigma-70 family RNA polymerase sigma factor [Planctomycetes bacterium]|nr:sigma-70 family RNA polymerase sigma factor [Planctomycetota bacterium]
MEKQPTFDAAWKLRACAGDKQAVGELVDASLEPLFRFSFYRVGRNRHLCEEVVQDTILRAIAELPNYDPERSANNVFPWMAGLARNEIRRALSRELATTSLETLWAKMDEDLRTIFRGLESSPLAADILVREETREMVNATMSQLPQHYREALEAKYVSRRSVREIAAARSASEKSIESLLTRARQAFRETFLALARNLNTEPFNP